MKIQPNTVVALDYTLTIDSGEQIDSSSPGHPMEFVAGTGQVIPGLERQLVGLAEGESARITVEPDEAYGPSRAEMVRAFQRTDFPTDVALVPGAVFHLESPQGKVPVSVRDVRGDIVDVDFNHPLAGQRLHFDVRVAHVRPASTQEILAARCGAKTCGTDCACN